MGDEPLWKILLVLVERVMDRVMNNRVLSGFVLGMVLLFLGMTFLYAFTEMFGFERLRNETGAVFVISALLTVFAMKVVPWGFPSLSNWYRRPSVRKVLVVLLGLALVVDALYWTLAALGYR